MGKIYFSSKAEAKQYEKSYTIAVGRWCFTKWNNEYNLKMSDMEIIRAAIWSYRKFGFGCVSLDAYLEYKNQKLTSRLYNTDVKSWYRIIKTAFKRDNYTCVYCGCVGGKLEGDHKIPTSKGGTNKLENIVTSCRRCNRQKKDKSVEEFLIWRANRYGKAIY